MSNLEVRYYLGSDGDHLYAVPVHKREEWNVWVDSQEAADGLDPPPWVKRIDGAFSFTDPRT